MVLGLNLTLNLVRYEKNKLLINNNSLIII